VFIILSVAQENAKFTFQFALKVFCQFEFEVNWRKSFWRTRSFQWWTGENECRGWP